MAQNGGWSLPFPPPPPVTYHGNVFSHGFSSSDEVDSPSITSGLGVSRSSYLLYLHSLLHILLLRHPTLSQSTPQAEVATASVNGEKLSPRAKNAERIGRIVRVLWSSREWREGDLWKVGVSWSGLERRPLDDLPLQERQPDALPTGQNASREGAVQHSDTSDNQHAQPSDTDAEQITVTNFREPISTAPNHHDHPSSPRESSYTRNTLNGNERTASHQRAEFLRAVAVRRRGLRPLMLACRAQEMILMGQWQQALDEIELVIQAANYRTQPELGLYAGLLTLLLASEQRQDSESVTHTGSLFRAGDPQSLTH